MEYCNGFANKIQERNSRSHSALRVRIAPPVTDSAACPRYVPTMRRERPDGCPAWDRTLRLQESQERRTFYHTHGGDSSMKKKICGTVAVQQAVQDAKRKKLQIISVRIEK